MTRRRRSLQPLSTTAGTKCGGIEVGTSNRVSLESLTTGRSSELRGMLPPERTTGH